MAEGKMASFARLATFFRYGTSRLAFNARRPLVCTAGDPEAPLHEASTDVSASIDECKIASHH